VENINNIEMKKLVLKLILLFVFFVLLILVAVRWNVQQPVKNLRIVGTSIIPEDEIASLLKGKVIDTPKSNIKLSRLKEEVHSVPLIDEAYSSYKTANEIVIAVSEKQIEALLIADNEKKYFVDSDSKLLNYKLYKNLPDLPLLRDITNGEKVDTLLLQNAILLIKKIKLIADSTLLREISEIYFDKNKRAFILIFNDYGREAIVGNKDLFDSSLEKLSIYFQEKRKNNILEQVSYIDLRYLNSIYFAFNK